MHLVCFLTIDLHSEHQNKRKCKLKLNSLNVPMEYEISYVKSS